MSEKAKPEHIGFKTLGMVLGLLLGTIWVIFDVLKNWLVAEDIWAAATRTLSGFGVLVILVPAFPYLSHMIWRLVFAAEEKIG